MCEITFIGRASDGLVLTETWDDLTTNRSLQSYKHQAKQILKNVGSEIGSEKCSVDSGNYVFYYIVDGGVIYMTLCSKSYPKKLAFSFLQEVIKYFFEELKKEFGNKDGDYRANIESIDKPYYFIKFDRIIQRCKSEYRDPRSSKSLQKLNDSLIEVTNIMKRNVDDILLRGENLNEVERKANDLKYASLEFSRAAKKLSLQALIQKYAPFIALLTVFLLVIAWKLLL
ncbi:synaptobrevin family protein [Cryptosporidium muris RN66]|uniref:Synaptobrevin family protein n=1 Tax=Cryptosporidium muris (strain RN66) TaxID=441375 RepID=B6AGZ9_CRYMR|nr:synaptobrevin family protein [Cryptosporidium muris RN66]EEA07490.1 synaptobrevin family protein [Cryptosporidium muris RN66]|eukprot:XP_002141839.1 synaptobrevin family protein [Cryptosporidium muris RN66]